MLSCLLLIVRLGSTAVLETAVVATLLVLSVLKLSLPSFGAHSRTNSFAIRRFAEQGLSEKKLIDLAVPCSYFQFCPTPSPKSNTHNSKPPRPEAQSPKPRNLEAPS